MNDANLLAVLSRRPKQLEICERRKQYNQVQFKIMQRMII